MKKTISIFLVSGFFLLVSGCNQCANPPSKNSTAEKTETEKNDNETVYCKNAGEYYKSLFIRNAVKDLEKRVFTGQTIMEQLDRTYNYQLPIGYNVKVNYFSKECRALFELETTMTEGIKFVLYGDYELLRVRAPDYFFLVCLSDSGIFQIIKLADGKLDSVSYFRGKYKGTLMNEDFSEENNAMQEKAEKFCRDFFKNEYASWKRDLEIADFYRIYSKAMRKQR